LALLVRARACTAIMGLLNYDLTVFREPSQRIMELGESLARSATETQDLRIAACHAYFKDMRQTGRTGEGFEKAAARLVLAPNTAAILGRSRARYREAVDLLMSAGSIEEAERYCFMNGDPGLAAAYAEKRNDLKAAARYYRDVRDMDGALRCAKASGDAPTIARVYEWRGEVTEALRIWKQAGRNRDVARLLKKYPLLRA
jgi:tetratricopeptide (TPR) repeat protein